MSERADPTQLPGGALWHPFAPMGAVRDRRLVITRGEGVWLWDDRGRRYLDASASLWYANIGHGRPEIAVAVADQLSTLETYTIFNDMANRPALELAERIARVAPLPGAKVFLACGGGDGAEAAVKLVRRYWDVLGFSERTHVLARARGYHGTHGFGTSLGGIAPNRAGFGPLAPHVGVLERDSTDELEARIDELGPERVAAFIFEPVVGSGGVHPPPPGFLEDAQRICREHGILLIADETICGFGRLGAWFGIERWDLQPDLAIFAKGVSSGYLPLGGVVVGERVAAPFWSDRDAPAFRHGQTYAGHAACCVAGLVNLDILEREGLVDRARELEGPLLEAMRSLLDHPEVVEARGGTGLMAGVELAPDLVARMPDAALRLQGYVREQGVLVRGLISSVTVSPPLIVEREHIERTQAAMASGLRKLARARATVTA